MMPHLEAPLRLQGSCDERESIDFLVNVDLDRFLHFLSKYPRARKPLATLKRIAEIGPRVLADSVGLTEKHRGLPSVHCT